MSQNTHVPKFGNWDGTVPYTQYFDNARKGRMEGKIINPNDPIENPEAFSAAMQPVRSPSHVTAPHSRARKPKGELPRRKEDSIQQPNGSFLSYDSGSFRRTEDAHDRQHRNQTSSGNQQRRGSRVSGSASNDRGNYSPLRHNYRMNDGGHSSAEGLSATSHGFTSAGRLRMTNVRDEKNAIKKGSSLPKFGEWDESNPASAEGFTDVFNKVREDKHTGPAQDANISSTHSTYNNGHHNTQKWSASWFFGCCKK